MNRTILLAAVALLGVLPAARAQSGPPGMVRMQSPLLYVRFNGTPGGRVTLYRGDQGGPRELEFPVTVGLRPGYIYRVKITGLPGQRQPIYPTLEVRGTLFLSPQTPPQEHPAPLALTETDVERVFGGVFLTKVIYLENPDLAAPAGTRPGPLLERSLPPGTDLVDEARQYGRLMLIVRAGERQPDAAEVAHWGVPGTILLPTEKTLPTPRVPPCVPFACVPFFDPALGPKPPDEECLHDGGDTGARAAIGPGGRLTGLDPSDTVAEYTDSRGRRHVTCSNRVCLCVPRFGALRSELPLAGIQTNVALGDSHKALGQVQIDMRVPSVEAHHTEQLTAYRVKQRPSVTANETAVGRLLRVEVLDAYHVYEGPALALGTAAASELTQVERLRILKQMELARGFSNRTAATAVRQTKGTAVVGRVVGLGLFTAEAELADVTALCNEEPQLLADKPMHLYKWAEFKHPDRESPQIGDVVTFYLRYSNNGGKPVEDVAVSDSLTGRLEYVPGSAKADRNAVLTQQANEAGSVILRWEITGPLLPGQGGVVSFQARVR